MLQWRRLRRGVSLKLIMNQSVLQAGRYSKLNNWIECQSAGLPTFILTFLRAIGFSAQFILIFIYLFIGYITHWCD